MSEAADHSDALRKAALSAYEAEHSRLVDVWKALESKAQATVAIAGIFIGGTLALAKDIKPDADPLTRVAIFLLTCILLGVVICGIQALRVTDVAGAPGGESLEGLAAALLALPPAELPDRMPRFFGDVSGIWRKANAEHRTVNEKKARWIAWGQWLLLSAIVAAAGLTTWTLFRPRGQTSDQQSTGGTINAVYQVGLPAGSDSGQQLLQRPSARGVKVHAVGGRH